jgi:hypothetical protein
MAALARISWQEFDGERMSLKGLKSLFDFD